MESIIKNNINSYFILSQLIIYLFKLLLMFFFCTNLTLSKQITWIKINIYAYEQSKQVFFN